MITIEFSPQCLKQLKILKTKQSQLFNKISQQLARFQYYPTHPSLRLHKLQGNLQDTWSISITQSIRMVFYYRDDKKEKTAVFITVGTHKQVYQ